MYFVTNGHLNMQSNSLLDRPVGLGAGSYFGERGLLGSSISVYTVRTVRACDLFSLSSEAFIQAIQQHGFSWLALDICTRSYKQIKEKRVVTCSEHEMEEHWGAALLLTVQEISRQGQATASGEESAEQEVETSSSTDFKLLSDAVVSRSETTEETSIDDAELPAHLEAMTKVLKTPTTVFKRWHRYFTLC